MSYAVKVELDVSDYGLLRAIIAQVANLNKTRPCEHNAQGIITAYRVPQLFEGQDDIQLATRYLLEQLPRRPQA